MGTDWQTWVTLGMGLMAASYLARRWWPTARGLFGLSGLKAAQAEGIAASAGCGTQTMSKTVFSSCHSGCGQCHKASETRDKPVQWAGRPPS